MRSTYLLFYFIVTLINYSNAKLRFAFEIFRHGARSPYSGLTADNKDWFGEKWDGGAKELTSVGLRMHFSLGMLNQKRYITDEKLITKPYDSREILVVSTDTNRTILSATAQLQGFYYDKDTKTPLNEAQITFAKPPNDLSKVTSDIETALAKNALPNGMNVYPVHSFFVKEHTFQLQEEKNCPGIARLYEENNARKEMKTFISDLNSNYPKICEKINKGKNCFDDLDLTDSVLDAIMQEKIDGRDMTAYFQAMGYSRDALFKEGMKYFKLVFVGNGIDSDAKIGLIGMSPTMRNIINWMEKKISYDLKGQSDYVGFDSPKFVMYSGHDDSVGTFQAFMKVVFDVSIEYIDLAGNAFLELHTKEGVITPLSKSDYVVKYYVNSVLKKLQGNEAMPYETFKESLEDKLYSQSQIANICQYDDDIIFFIFSKKNAKLNTFIGLTIFFIIMSVVFAIVIIILALKIKKMKRSPSGPMNLPEENETSGKPQSEPVPLV